MKPIQTYYVIATARREGAPLVKGSFIVGGDSFMYPDGIVNAVIMLSNAGRTIHRLTLITNPVVAESLPAFDFNK
jgi:hypothetical protein